MTKIVATPEMIANLPPVGSPSSNVLQDLLDAQQPVQLEPLVRDPVAMAHLALDIGLLQQEWATSGLLRPVLAKMLGRLDERLAAAGFVRIAHEKVSNDYGQFGPVLKASLSHRWKHPDIPMPFDATVLLHFTGQPGFVGNVNLELTLWDLEAVKATGVLGRQGFGKSYSVAPVRAKPFETALEWEDYVLSKIESFIETQLDECVAEAMSRLEDCATP